MSEKYYSQTEVKILLSRMANEYNEQQEWLVSHERHLTNSDVIITGHNQIAIVEKWAQEYGFWQPSDEQEEKIRSLTSQLESEKRIVAAHADSLALWDKLFHHIQDDMETLAEAYSATHAEKRGAIKFLKLQWQAIRNRFPYVSTADDLPF